MGRGRPRKVIELREAPVLDAEAVEVLVDCLDLISDRLFPLQEKVHQVREEVEKFSDNQKAAWACKFLDELFGDVVGGLGCVEEAQAWLRKGVS
ncbi:MAG: hypothetical protein IJG40_16115 [Oscillospiraceae bacterium]|nr:hypothetical protein [Oscillospiraceae bacterium]